MLGYSQTAPTGRHNSQGDCACCKRLKTYKSQIGIHTFQTINGWSNTSTRRIVDNYCTHKHAKAYQWLKRHPRFHIHFIPTSSSRLNLVERWFGKITDKRIRRGSFQNVGQLQAAIQEFIEVHNDDPQPFAWSAPVERIPEKIAKSQETVRDTTLGVPVIKVSAGTSTRPITP